MVALADKPTTLPESPTTPATDLVGFLTPEGLKALNERLVAYENRTKHQLWVWIGKTAGPVPHAEFCHVTFNAWGVGRKGVDDGVVLFIFAEQGWWHITVGYGLEKSITDAEAARIATHAPRPGLAVGDKDQAVNDAVSAIVAEIAKGKK